MENSKTLDQLRPGEQGVLQQYFGDGDLQGRLKELGLVRGTLIAVERFAPMWPLCHNPIPAPSALPATPGAG